MTSSGQLRAEFNASDARSCHSGGDNVVRRDQNPGHDDKIPEGSD
jgi:hypothetical protein